MRADLNIAILGAECTGKTALVRALTGHLEEAYPRVQSVAEYLREWCAQHRRTPRADEQAHIAHTQFERVVQARAAAQGAGAPVLCDTSPLMTAIYSDLLFGDRSLYASAVAQQRSFGLTLVTGLDLPWQADGYMRDGVAMRAQVDQRLRQVLREHALDFSSIYGVGEARTQHALQAVSFALGTARPSTAASGWRWPCDKCSDPQCEHRLFRDLLNSA